MHVTAIIVARGGSQRVPGKALRPFGDSTLIGHKVKQLKACDRIDDVVVGSDDDAILAEAASCGASVRRRDAYHCDESQCSANEMIRNMAAMVETDVVVWAHPTNPLCPPDVYDAAVDAFKDGGDHDSLCSVTKVQRHAWVTSETVTEKLKLNTLKLNGPWPLNIQAHRQMIENAYFYGRCPLLFEIEEPYDLDVDTERDLLLAQKHWRCMQLCDKEAAPC